MLPLYRKATRLSCSPIRQRHLKVWTSVCQGNVNKELLCRSAASQDGSGNQTTATFGMECTKLSSVCYCLPLFHCPTLTLGSSDNLFSVQVELLSKSLERTWTSSAPKDGDGCHGLSKSARPVRARQHEDEVCYKLVEMKSTSVNHLSRLPKCERDIILLELMKLIKFRNKMNLLKSHTSWYEVLSWVQIWLCLLLRHNSKSHSWLFS